MDIRYASRNYLLIFSCSITLAQRALDNLRFTLHERLLYTTSLYSGMLFHHAHLPRFSSCNHALAEYRLRGIGGRL